MGVVVEARSVPALTHVLPHIRSLGFPICVNPWLKISEHL